MKRILVAGGGTAGHIYPALAVVEELKGSHDVELLFVGGRGGLERELVAKAAIPFRGILTGKWRRYPDLRNLIDPFKAGAGTIEALGILASFRPDVVFAKGGYVTVPVVLSAKGRRIPIVSHESDLVMGLSNRLSNRLAARICVSFPVAEYPEHLRSKLIFTGNPIRAEFTRVKSRKFHNNFGLSPSLPVVLVVGGSQGALGLNELVTGCVDALTARAQILHITGESDLARVEEIKKKLPPAKAGRYIVQAFLTDIAQAMATADLVISRAGANVLFELAYLEKPTIILPLPSSASDHQRKNAQYFGRSGAAVVLEQDTTTSGELLKVVDRLLHDDIERGKLAHAIADLAAPEAAVNVAKVIMETAK